VLFPERVKWIDQGVGVSWQVPFLALLFSNFVSGEFGVIQIGFYCSIGTHSIILLCGW
jgi:hypothetical protein